MSSLKTDARGDLIDLSGLSLRELDDQLGESAIDAALREALDPVQCDVTAAGFNSYGGDGPTA